MTIRQATMVLFILSAAGYAASAQAQRCHREGADVTCDDGHRGVWEGDAIIWADGTRSHSSPHPSDRQQIIGHDRARRFRRSGQRREAA
jgi:hypothetical protein